MDIVVKGILDYIQSLEGHKNTILAGGAPRDILLGLTPKDYDLCIPSRNNKQIHDLARSIVQEFNIQDMVLKTKEYDKQEGRLRNRSGVLVHTSKLTCVYGFTFEGKKIDLIGHKEDDDEDFANEVIQGFDFGINMVYDTGSYVCDDNSNFREDLDYRSMTLVNLPSMSELPKAIERYNRLSSRYKEVFGNELRFRSTCLELNKPKSKVTGYDPMVSYKKYHELSDTTVVGEWNQPEPDMGTIQFGPAAPTWGQAVVTNPIFVGDTAVTASDEFDDNF